jgi:hypothetical protein
MNEVHQLHQDVQKEIRTPAAIRFIRGVYWFLAFLGICILARKAVGAESMAKLSETGISLTILINLTILIGIYKRRSWIVPLVTFFSCWRLVTYSLHVLGEKIADIRMLEQKGVYLIGAVFCAYQMSFSPGKKQKPTSVKKGRRYFRASPHQPHFYDLPPILPSHPVSESMCALIPSKNTQPLGTRRHIRDKSCKMPSY